MYNPSIKSQPSSSSTNVTQLPQVLVQVQDVLVQVSEPLLNLEERELFLDSQVY